MTLATKIGAGFLILVTLMAALSWSQLALISRLHGESRELSQISFEAASLSLRLQSQVTRLRELSHKSLILRDPAYATAANEVRLEIEGDLARLQALELAEDERRELEGLASLWQAYPAQEDGAMTRRGSVARRSEVKQLRARLDESSDALNGQLSQLATASRAAMARRVEVGGERVEQAHRTAWGVTLAGLVAAVLIAAGIVGSLVRPLRRLGRGTRVLAAGDFAHRVPAEGGPELAALAEDFNHMAQQLSELDSLKKDFLANISHDLKTPLASMLEATKLLLEEIPGPLEERQQRLLSLNLKSGNRLYRMIEDLLDLSRIEAGSFEVSPRRQDLVDLARTALDEIGGLVNDGKLTLDLDFPDQPVVVACDGSAVLKVFHNLLSNAVKFTPAGGTIGFKIRPLVDRSQVPPAIQQAWPGETYLPAVEIAIADTGPGVPDEHKHKIFERFYRIDADPAGAPGTGLGLAIGHQVVAGHGGELWVEDGPAGGSVFRVVLWSQPPAEASAGTTDGEVTSGAGKHRRTVAALALLAVSLGPLSGCDRPAPIVQPGPLQIGDAAFDRGDYSAASDAYQDHLDRGLPAATDRVLFRLALMYALPTSPVHDPRRARKLLGELAERFPESSYRGAAEYLFGLQREVEILRRQLEEIKRIDLGTGPD